MPTPIEVSFGPVSATWVPETPPLYIALSIMTGGGQVSGVQALRGLVQNTEPHVVGSVPVGTGTMRLLPPSDSVATRAPAAASTSSTTLSPHANRYRFPFLVGVTGL